MLLTAEDRVIDEAPVKKKIRFGSPRTVFFAELRKEVQAYFQQKGIESKGNTSLYLKASFFIVSYLGGYVLLITAALPALWSVLLCAYLGFIAAGIGFNLMHDGAHGSFSNKNWVNNFAAYSVNVLGGDAVLWKNKHNMIHHTYTNIEGHDQDIAQMPVLLLNDLQKKYAFHKYQHIYCFFVYGLSSLLWVFLLDFIKYFSGKIGTHNIASYTLKDHVVFWASKIGYFTAYLFIPSLVWGWGATIIGFIAYHFMLGLTLSVVFQLAHVVENTEFTDGDLSDEPLENEWAIHQLKTTTNFATKNKLITWFVGGLNYQVEHHLFPNISHVHYPALNSIVKNTCAKYDVVYNEYTTFNDALGSHLRHLRSTANS